MKTGDIWVPWTTVTTATYLNGEMVWHRNKWVNLWLKIKRIFKKPSTYTPTKKLASGYSTKTINPEFFGTIKISDI